MTRGLHPRAWGLRVKLFALSVALVAVGLLGAQWFVADALGRRLDAYTRAQLTTEAQLAGAAVRASGRWSPEGADGLLREIAAHLGGRVTLIGPDGVVRADSAVPRASLAVMENHNTRPEVIAARRHGTGVSVRTSDTLRRPLVYAATRVDGPGGRWVVRVAVSHALASGAATDVRRLTAVGALLGIVLAAGMSALASSLASRPLRRLTDTARAMVKDLSVRTRVRQDDEVGALAEALDALADNLAASLQSLGTERDRLGAILEAMAEGVLVTDRWGNLALANRAVREMLLVGRDVIGQRPIEALRNAELHEAFEAVRAEEGPVTREVTFTGVRPRRVMVRVTGVDDPPTGFVAVLSDVTELRRLETMRRDFVANVSHELRTPVAAIRAASETLLMGAVSQPAMAQEFVGIIDRHAERLHRLVEDLLELSRLEARELKIALAPTELGPEVARAKELVAMAAGARRTDVRVALDDDLPLVRADRKALEHVLVNLLDNAIKYSGEGATVTVRAARRGEGVRLTVADDGPGIEARHLPRLFERFYRVDASRSRQVGGTGLGLAIVKHLCEAMEARVSVESEVGEGARFHVDLLAAG